MDQYTKEILQLHQSEINSIKKFRIYKNNIQQIKDTKEHLINNNYTIVQSDKTHRLVITKVEQHREQTANMLKDTNNYKLLDKSKTIQIEKQSNQIIKNVSKKMKLTHSQTDQLLTCGSQPAKFNSFIKDHKEKNLDGNYPLRPVASVVNTPTEKR